ncbi:hypothetical protein QZH41_011935 [Actinostola sp. cb2023]|nr:hypothetical protein QZH41_015728 [Actinostola sp. cb2023]KAK3746983.1 hypothetical protein QZH41_011935 [Actinostola sp. cb2023]
MAAVLNAANNTSPTATINPTNETVTEYKSLKCPDFKVFAVSNTLNIPYTVTCCLGIVFAFYFIIVGKNSVTLQGEDKAMQRYRSLNMNGDVVTKSYYQGEDPGKATEV